jgi:flagellar protein FlgJ
MNVKAASIGSEPAASGDQARRLKEACQGFESMFIRILLREMRSGVVESSLFGDRREEGLLVEMFDDALADSLAQAGGLGLADVLYDQLARQVLGA